MLPVQLPVSIEPSLDVMRKKGVFVNSTIIEVLPRTHYRLGCPGSEPALAEPLVAPVHHYPSSSCTRVERRMPTVARIRGEASPRDSRQATRINCLTSAGIVS